MEDFSKRSLDRRQFYLFILIMILVTSILCFTITLLIVHASKPTKENAEGQLNILFIIVDDLRPALGCYGDQIAITPNIDLLASRSIIFQNAYTQQSLDGPSRISLMTSRRPDTLHLYDNNRYWRKSAGNFITLPQHFKNYNYEVLSVGKVFSHDKTSNRSDDFPYSWSRLPFWPSSEKDEMKPVCNSTDGQKRLNLICPVNVDDLPSKTLPDIEVTEYAVQYLKDKSENGNKSEFFLAVGYHKPHIPFKVPKSYFDLYKNVNFSTNHAPMTKIPKVSWNPWTDIREMDDVKVLNTTFPYGQLPEDFQRLIRHGYYSSISYIDDQIGKLLQALEDSGFAEHTAVVLLGDNGWSLGEHKEWSKYSNFEVALRVPLIIHIPGFTDDEDRKPFKYIPVLDINPTSNNPTEEINTVKHSQAAYVSHELVELVDIFPTVADLADIPVPSLCAKNETRDFCSEGVSLYPVIQHAILDPWISLFSWKTAAFSQYPRPSLNPSVNSDKPALEDIEIMGYSIRTETYRYTEWVAFDNDILKPDWPLIISRELYNHAVDPREENNVCDEDEYANTVIALSRRIKKGWLNELPPGSE